MRDWDPLSSQGSDPFLSGKPAVENIIWPKTITAFTFKKVESERLLIW